MISQILFLVSLFGYVSLYKFVIKDKNVARAMFLSYGTMMILMYLFLFFGQLRLGAYLVITMGFAFFLALIWKFKTLYKYSLNISLVFFIMSVLILLVFTRSQETYIHDDFSHWMKQVKQMHYYDSYFVPMSPIEEDSYMPAFMPLCYAATKCFGYSEGLIYTVKSIGVLIFFSFFLSFILEDVKDRKSRIIAGLISIFIFFMFPIFNTYSYGFNNLLVDMELGMLFGIGLVYSVVYKKDDRNIFYFVPIFMTLIILTFLKLGTGLMFAYFIAFYNVISIFVRMLKGEGTFKEKIKRNKKNIYIALSLIMIPYIVNMSWNICYNFNKNIITSIEEGTGITPLEFNEYFKSATNKNTSLKYPFTGGLDEFKLGIIKTFLKNIIFESNVFLRGVPRSVFIFLFLLLGILIFYYLEKDDKIDIMKLFTIASISTIVFILGLYVIYVNFIKMSSEEYRYLGTCFTAFVMILIYMCSLVFKGRVKKERMIKTSIYILITICFLISYKPHYLHVWYKPRSSEYFGDGHEDARRRYNLINDFISSSEETVLYISEDESSLEVYALQYYLLPVRARYLNVSYYQDFERIMNYAKKYKFDYVVINRGGIKSYDFFDDFYEEGTLLGDNIYIYKMGA